MGGIPECYDKVQTVVQDAPKEQCTLEPQRTCKHVTKLVPKLSPPRSAWMYPRGVHQVQDQPQEGEEACGEEVVLRSFRGIWPCLILFILIKLPFIVAEDMNIIFLSQLFPGVLKTLWCHRC